MYMEIPHTLSQADHLRVAMQDAGFVPKPPPPSCALRVFGGSHIAHNGHLHKLRPLSSHPRPHFQPRRILQGQP